MPVKNNSLSAAEIPDGEEDQRFNPEAEVGEQEDLEAKDEVKDDEEVGDDDEEEEVKAEEGEEEEEEEDKEDDEEDDEEDEVNEDGEEEDSKDKSPSLSSGEQTEFMELDLGEIRKDVQCPICLGIIKKTRTVMECLHRFCRECIDKSMRLGNNECPACRKHCASRRSLRDDPKFDALIAALFTNIDTYEEEEMAFHEDDKARNKQIQASIAQVSQRQSEALGKKRSIGKDSAVLMRSQRSGGGSTSRRTRNSRNEAHDDDDNSSSDERGVVQRKRRKRSTVRSTPTTTQQNPSSSNAVANGNCGDNNETELVCRENKGISPGLVWNPDMLAWGRGGTRSNTRHGNNTSLKNARVNRVVEYLRNNVDGNSVEDIHLKLLSLDTKRIPDLPQPYLGCRSTLLVKQLREFVAVQIHLKTEEVELLVKIGGRGDKEIESLPVVTSASADEIMRNLEDDETLSRLKVDFISSNEQDLIIGYRQKQTE